MLRKSFNVVLVVAVAVVLVACGGGKYDDVIEVQNNFASATEAYVNGMESAEDAPSIAKAMDNYAAAIEKLAPNFREIREKYPELEDTSKTPEELEDSQARMDSVAAKMAGAMMKSMMFIRDAEVSTAQKRLQEALSLLGK